jgi:hypothetical protein
MSDEENFEPSFTPEPDVREDGELSPGGAETSVRYDPCHIHLACGVYFLSP